MPLAPGTIIAERYSLQSRLGTGAMGEVWRAQDTRFESRSVAVKVLREDETLKDDAQNRERFLVKIEQQAARGPLTAAGVFDAIASALATNNSDGLREKIRERFGGGTLAVPDVIALFDSLVTDPAFNENARMRAKLRRLFRDEANAVANLRHDHIVSIFDYGDHEGSPYLVMDYIEGRTLHQVIEGKEPLSQSRKLRLIEDLCAGLGYAHRRKLVHRDIKPANLIIDSSTDSLKILDFGVVRRLGTESTIGIPIGTFCYMSPEQTRGAATLDHRSDIFAVGLVFYELMAGKKAFPPGRGVGDLVSRIQRDPPRPLKELLPGIAQNIDDIINRAIAKEPDDRYQDLSVMEREIARVRTKIEAEDTSEKTQFLNVADPAVVKARAQQPDGAELLHNAERAFASGDDNAAIELSNRALAVAPSLAAAISLRSRAEERQKDARAAALLQQADKFLQLDDVKAAQASFDQARELRPSDASVLAFSYKMQAAVTKRTPPPPSPPPAPPIEAGPTLAMPVAAFRPVPESPAGSTPGTREPIAIPKFDSGAEPKAPVAPETIELTIRSPRPSFDPPQRPPVVPPPAPPPVDRPTILDAPVPRSSAPPLAPPPVDRPTILDAPVPRPSPPPPEDPSAATQLIAPIPAAIPTPAPAPPVARPPATKAPAGPARGGPNVPASVTRTGSNPLPLLGAIAAILILTVIAFLFMQSRKQDPDPVAAVTTTVAPPVDQPAVVPPPGTDTAPVTTVPADALTPAEPPPPASMTSVVIDIRPWARVRITVAPPAEGQTATPPAVQLPVEARFAPFTIDLPAGDYLLECENGGLNRTTTIPLKVAEPQGRPQFFTRAMPGFNSTKIVDSLLPRD